MRQMRDRRLVHIVVNGDMLCVPRTGVELDRLGLSR